MPLTFNVTLDLLDVIEDHSDESGNVDECVALTAEITAV